MKIFYSHQVREADAYTIKHEPIESIDLMERAATQLTEWLYSFFGNAQFVIFAGPGNNGGDGLATARLLYEKGCKVEVYEVNFTEKRSTDFKINYERLLKLGISPVKINDATQFPDIDSEAVIIDAIFGSGLSRPVEGLAADVIKNINRLENIVVSVDIPSGLFGEDNTANVPEHIVKADYTLTFQYPNLSFLLPENEEFVGEWVVLDIGISKEYIDNTKADYYLVEKADASKLLKPRSKFSHKGTFGHGLLVAGSYGKMGASVLAANAAMRSGLGLLTVHLPSCGYEIMQTAFPEAMISIDPNDKIVTEVVDLDKYDALAFGPGVGTDKQSLMLLAKLLETKKPMVIDADGLNLLSQHKDLLDLLHDNVILTPHPKEFERLTGKNAINGYERLQQLRDFAFERNVTVVLKGHYTQIAVPQEKIVYFNTTGNPGMATGGSGDVLTGIILGFLTQGYSIKDSAILGVYLHGLAGDISLDYESYESLIASDIVNNLGQAFNVLRD